MGDPSDFTLGRGRKSVRPIRLLTMDDPAGVRMMGRDGFVHNVKKADFAYAKSKGWLAPKPNRPTEAGREGGERG